MVIAESDLPAVFVSIREAQNHERVAQAPTTADASEEDINAPNLNEAAKVADQSTNETLVGKETASSIVKDETEVEIVPGVESAAEQDFTEAITATDKETKDTQSNNVDADIIAQANEYVRQERLLEAARALRKVQGISPLQEKHRKVLQKAEKIEATVITLTSSPDDGWTKQGESHGNYDTIIYYKVDKAARLTARIETPIDASLLVPLLSVFNESELYESWMPHMNGLGVSQSVKLRQTGRGNQIIAVTSYLPWPLADREAIIEATAVDDISTNNHIVVKMETRYEGEEDGLIPPPKPGVVRVDFDGGILFRRCPEDHPAFAKSKHPDHKGPMILVCLTMFVDAHVQYVPQKLINFVTRTVLGRMWASLLKVAEDIRDGSRPEHAKAIVAKRDLYEWVEQRVEVMIDGMDVTESATAVK